MTCIYCTYFQDLEELCRTASATTGGRSNNPMSVLVDYLMRPDLDIGHEHASSLKWVKEPRSVPHVVLGKGAPGGSWQVSRFIFVWCGAVCNVFFIYICFLWDIICM